MSYSELSSEAQNRAIEEVIKLMKDSELDLEFQVEYILRAKFRENGALLNGSSIKRDIKHLKLFI